METEKYRVLVAEVHWSDDDISFFQILAIKGLYETYGQCPQDAFDSARRSGKSFFAGTWQPLLCHEAYGLWIYIQVANKDVIALVETHSRFSRIFWDQGADIWFAGEKITPELARLEINRRNEFMTGTGKRELVEADANIKKEMQEERKRQASQAKWNEEKYRRETDNLRGTVEYLHKKERDAERKGIAGGHFRREARSGEDALESHLRKGPEPPSRNSGGIAQKFKARPGESEDRSWILGLALGAALVGYLIYKVPSFGVPIAMVVLGILAVVMRRYLLGCLGVPILGLIWLGLILSTGKPRAKDAPTPPPLQAQGSSKVKHPQKKNGASVQAQKPQIPKDQISGN